MNVFVLEAICVILALLIYILWTQGHDRSVAYFRVTLICILLWTLSIIFTETDADATRVLSWSRLSFFFSALIAVSLQPFVFQLALETSSKRIFSWIHFAAAWAVAFFGVVFAALSLTPQILTSVHDLHSSFGPLQPAYDLFILASFVILGLNLAIARSRTSGHIRSQFGFILLGVSLSAAFAIVTNLLLPFLHLGEMRFLGPVGLIFFIASTSYVILAHHLFDIRVAIRRTVVYSILLTTLFSAYGLLIFLFAQIFYLDSTDSLAVNFLATLVIGFSFDPLRRWLQDRTDKFLYKKEYEQQAVLKDLSTNLNNVVGLDEALEIVMQTIVRTLKLSHAVSYVFQPGEHGSLVIRRIKQSGYAVNKNLILQDRDFIMDYFGIFSQITSLTRMREELQESGTEIERLERRPHSKQAADLGGKIREQAKKLGVIKKLQSLDAEIAVPLHLGPQFIGLILLSGKLSQDRFDASDLQLLELAGGVAISSIQKAKLYEGDQMKTEFVSIASHELLTPISAMEGYLSMILDENLGKVDDQAREYLNKVYISARRLSQLVKDLLSVSRLESGKMAITLQAVDMGRLIGDTLDQLRFLAQSKGLELNYSKGASELPLVRADPDRVMQILTNLVSNAIKYTPSGSVTITASRGRKQELRVCVTDTGLGMSKAEQAHLFERFYRVANSETVGIVGTGLGLYITRSTLEKMGGQITLESAPKRGTAFTFTLPLFEAETVGRIG
jgi:signal transduction histidine kinase